MHKHRTREVHLTAEGWFIIAANDTCSSSCVVIYILQIKVHPRCCQDVISLAAECVRQSSVSDPLCKRTGCPHTLAAVKNAAVDGGVHISLQINVSKIFR